MAAPTRPAHLRAVPSTASGGLTLADVYREQVDFVVRSTRHLGVPEPQVEDVVHEVFLVVHRRLSDYDERGSMRSWLYGITRRVVMHHQRGTSRARAREAHAPPPKPIPGAEEDLLRRQTAAAVARCIDALDPDQRTVFVLADVDGLTAPEIAKAEGIKVNTVYSRLRLARRKFEKLLARALGEDGHEEKRR